MIRWQASTVYGTRIALGPVQSLVLDHAMALTDGGRRPSLTLGRLSAITGAPVSSVHDALGRLRALGLLGVSARMGRIGGHRLWRVTARADRDLDPIRRRSAIARIVGRFGTTQARPSVSVAGPTGDDVGTSPPGAASSPVNHEPSDELEPRSSAPMALDPFLGTPIESPRPAPILAGGVDTAGETFGAKLRRYGLGPWIDER